LQEWAQRWTERTWAVEGSHGLGHLFGPAFACRRGAGAGRATQACRAGAAAEHRPGE